MSVKLICMDIDGTLLDENKKLLPQVKQAVRKVAERGVLIALASGRMLAGVELVEKELGIPCMKICNAGSYIIFKEQCIDSTYFSTDSMRSIYKKIAQRNQIPVWIFREKEWYVTKTDFYVEREIKIIQKKPQIVEAERLVEQWTQKQIGPNKMLIAAKTEQIPRFYQQIKELDLPDIEIACSSKEFIEIFPKETNKGVALRKICEKWKILLEDTIAFGDQELDIPMIEAAGIGIAMGNAIKQVKEKADIVTKTNNEAGVAYALEHMDDFRMGKGRENFIW